MVGSTESFPDTDTQMLDDYADIDTAKGDSATTELNACEGEQGEEEPLTDDETIEPVISHELAEKLANDSPSSASTKDDPKLVQKEPKPSEEKGNKETKDEKQADAKEKEDAKVQEQPSLSTKPAALALEGDAATKPTKDSAKEPGSPHGPEKDLNSDEDSKKRADREGDKTKKDISTAGRFKDCS